MNIEYRITQPMADQREGDSYCFFRDFEIDIISTACDHETYFSGQDVVVAKFGGQIINTYESTVAGWQPYEVFDAESGMWEFIYSRVFDRNGEIRTYIRKDMKFIEDASGIDISAFFRVALTDECRPHIASIMQRICKTLETRLFVVAGDASEYLTADELERCAFVTDFDDNLLFAARYCENESEETLKFQCGAFIDLKPTQDSVSKMNKEWEETSYPT